MLSIGLGQEQQFTLILQTLQQLRDVYGDSVDKIVQGNTNNIVFLKSTDDSMIDTLVKMSGQTHEVHQDSLTVTKDKERLLLPNEGKVSMTVSVQQTSVLKYNDFAFLPERNSIVFRAGDMPILNRNETIMPMSWKLLGKTIIHPGHEYSLQTIPTLSSAKDFDVRQNQPDFIKMLDKRLEQAYRSEECKRIFKDAYGYDDYQISRLDPDNYAAEVMEMIDRWIADDEAAKAMGEEMDVEMAEDDYDEYEDFDNAEQKAATAEAQQQYNEKFGHTYANGLVSREDLVKNGIVSHAMDVTFLEVFKEIKGDMFGDKTYFSVRDGQLYSADGKPYIVRGGESSEGLKSVEENLKNGTIHNVGENVTADDVAQISTFVITDEFYRFLVSLDHWDFARGRFEQAVVRRLS